MSKIETLTDAQRAAITNCTDEAAWHAGCDALRIIDHLTAALEAAEAKDNVKRAVAYLDRAEAAESRAEALQARVAELEAVREATLAPEGHGGYLDLVKRANAAESELADLRGRVERAEDELQATDKRPSFRIRRAWEILRGR